MSGLSGNENEVPSISPSDSRLVFAHKLGVSRFHKLKSHSGARKIINEMLHSHSELSSFFYAEKSNTFLTIAGLAESELFDTLNPAFRISSCPSTNAFASLMRRYERQLDSLDNGKTTDIYLNDIGGVISIHDSTGVYSQITTTPYKSLEDYEQLFGEDKASMFDISVKQDRVFLSEIYALKILVEFLSSKSQQERSDTSIVIGQLVGLEVCFSLCLFFF